MKPVQSNPSTIGKNSLLLLFTIFSLYQCGLVEYNFTNPFSGITETDSAGNTLSLDADDWRLVSVPTATLSPDEMPEIRPAFPNPATYKAIIFLRVQKDESDVDIHILDRQEKTIRVIQKGYLPAGIYNFRWDLDDDDGHLQKNDIYRCKISFTQDGYRFSSYGDIQILR